MRKLCAVLCLIMGLSALIWAENPAPKNGGTSLILNFTSTAITKGKVGDWANRNLTVLLPASYARDENRRFPVVYTFHGFNVSASILITALYPYLAEGYRGPDFIIVAVDGTSRYGGSFFVNSENTGYFEDMVTEEVVPFIDRSLRTIPSAAGRILAGFSMGGFAAWNLALAHADLFAGAWACCPGAFDANGLKDAMPGWGYAFRSGYGHAFAWRNVRNPAKGPVFDGSPADTELIKQWESGFGDIQGKLANYKKRGASLREIRFDYGAKDPYDWIARGSIATSQAMAAAGIKTSVAGHPASHEIYSSMIVEGFFPLVARLFAPDSLVSTGTPPPQSPEQKFHDWKAVILGEGPNSGGEILPEKGTANERNVVVFLGDSLTAGSGIPNNSAFPALIGKYWKEHEINYEAVNAGIGGRITQDALGALEPYLNDKTALIMLEIGLNDVQRDNVHRPIKSVKKNIQTMIDRCKAKGIPIVLAAMVLDPQTDNAPSNGVSLNEYICEFDLMYPELGKENAIPVMPFIMKNVVAGGSDYLLGDKRHANEKGHRIYTRDVLLFLNKNWIFE